MSLGRKNLTVLTHTVVRPACPSGQIVKSVMPGPASRFFVFSQLRKHETMTLTLCWGGGLHKSGQRSEYFSCLARMFEPVLRPGSFGLIAHDFGEP